MPSEVTPVLYRSRVAWRFPLILMDSRLVNVYLTGLPVARAPSAAMIWTEMSSLPPKPPPMGMPATRILSAGRPTAWEISATSMGGPWLATYTVRNPSPSTAATQDSGSR